MGTKIEYCDETVNPIRTKDGGWHCTKVSPGCKNCFAERINKRFGNGKPYDSRPTEYVFNKKALKKVERWHKPRKIFWQDMGDLFLPEIALNQFCKCNPPCPETEHNHDSMLQILLRIIYHLKASHTHIFLTKRPEVALDFTQRWSYLWKHIPNLHLGVSVENQQTADERIPILLQIPAAVRWVSVEPMLGPVKLPIAMCEKCQGLIYKDGNACPNCGQPCFGIKLDWVVCGGESGPGARPMHPDWVRKVRDDCVTAGVPFFFKQWGEWLPESIGGVLAKPKMGILIKDGGEFYISPEDWNGATSQYRPGDYECMYKVGKKAAGRLLDGVTHDKLLEAL